MLINNQLKKLLLLALLNGLSGSSFADERQAEVELNHWWNQPGELAALAVIRRAVEQRGGRFVDTPIRSWDKLRAGIIHRITVGYPPAVTQWLVDGDIFELNKMNVIHSSPTLLNGLPLKDILLRGLYDDVTEGGKLLVLPVGIHFQNAALFNAAIYRELKLPIPTTWAQVLDQAPVISAAGYVPLAFSKESWQLHMVFNTILLEVMGYDNYQLLYQKNRSIKEWRQALEHSFEVFLRLKAYADYEQNSRTWDMSAHMIGEKKAAMQVMGDFAKAELTNLGLTAGDDFICSLAPGSGHTIIYAIDSFLMLTMKEPYLVKGQDLLFEVVLDPEVQAAYSQKKGSIPIRYGVDLSQLDACTKASYQQWLSADRQVIRFSGVENPLRTSFFEATLSRAWKESELSAAQLTDQLIQSDESGLKPLPSNKKGRF